MSVTETAGGEMERQREMEKAVRQEERENKRELMRWGDTGKE